MFTWGKPTSASGSLSFHFYQALHRIKQTFSFVVNSKAYHHYEWPMCGNCKEMGESLHDLLSAQQTL